MDLADRTSSELLPQYSVKVDYRNWHISFLDFASMHHRGSFFLWLILLVHFSVGCAPLDENDRTADASSALNPDSIHITQVYGRSSLRALTTYGATSYFLYRGEAMGFEYDLLTNFAGYMGVNLELHVANDFDSVFHMLDNGTVDLVALGLAITKDRLPLAAFSEPIYSTRQVLVQRKMPGWRKLPEQQWRTSLVSEAFELIGDTVSVRRNSSYFQRLQHLSFEVGGDIYIDTLTGRWSTEEIIHKVLQGVVRYTVADDNLAAINASYHEDLDASLPLSLTQRVAWAVGKGHHSLRDSINAWLEAPGTRTYINERYHHYFRNQSGFRRRMDSDYHSTSQMHISPYDAIIRAHCAKAGWDWRLVASLMYQESRFVPDAQAWTSALGLMQLMPATAEALGIDDLLDPEQNIRGGVQYLQELWKQFEHIPDSMEKIKFTLAAYNCGYGHVKDAQRLAEKRGGDPLMWSDGVQNAMGDLQFPKAYNDPVVYYGYVRGAETVAFVQEIIDRYNHYCVFYADQQ